MAEHAGNHAPEAGVVWRFDAEVVEKIWRETGEVFGNSLWLDSMYELIPSDWQRQAGELTGLRLDDLLSRAVHQLDMDGDLADPSLFFLAFARTLADLGITAEFAPHPTYGSVLERAKAVEATGSAPAFAPEVWDFDQEMVEEVWLAIEDSLEDPDWIIERFEEMLLPEWRDEATLRARCAANLILFELVETLNDLEDPSVALVRVAEAFLPYGITIKYGPHPEHGDIDARAQAVLAGRAAENEAENEGEAENE